MWIYLSLAIAIVGLVVYLIERPNPKPTEIGRIMFWVGLLAFLLTAVGSHGIGIR